MVPGVRDAVFEPRRVRVGCERLLRPRALRVLRDARPVGAPPPGRRGPLAAALEKTQDEVDGNSGSSTETFPSRFPPLVGSP